MRQLSEVDRVLGELDAAIRAVFPPENRVVHRDMPGQALPEAHLNESEKKHVAGLMRVNHSGEVSAQGLYRGQALTAQLTHVKQQMAHAAEEEIEHLAWCEQRLRELNSRPSVLNPIWYAGSFCIGVVAGWLGDRWSLGFVEETENQVAAHLETHLAQIPSCDQKTHAVLEQMKQDEMQHAEMAQTAGAARLPLPIQWGMQWVSKIMTRSSYRI